MYKYEYMKQNHLRLPKVTPNIITIIVIKSSSSQNKIKILGGQKNV